MNTSTVPVYVSETSRSAVRGRSLAIQMSIVIVRHTLNGLIARETF